MKRARVLVYGFVGAMIMAWLGNYFYDSTKDDIKDIPILKYVIISFNWLYDFIIAILNFQLKVWWLIAAGVVFYISGKVLKATGQKQNPDFVSYKKDVFKKWIWRWDWKLTSSGWAIVNLTAYCPKDDVQLISSGDFFRARFYCPKCNSEYGEYREPLEYPADAEVLIRDKINKGNYPKTKDI